jgi:hypothetical protein
MPEYIASANVSSMQHCMCAIAPEINVPECEWLLMSHVECSTLHAPEMTLLILHGMPYGECYMSTVIDLQVYPKLKTIISLSSCIQLLNPRDDVRVLSIGLIEVDHKPFEHTIKDNIVIQTLDYYLETPECYKCSCFVPLPVTSDFFRFFAPMLEPYA